MNRLESIVVGTRDSTESSQRLLNFLITFSIGLSFILIMSQWGYTYTVSANMPKEIQSIIGVSSAQSAVGKALLGIVGGVLLLLPSSSFSNRQYRIAPLLFICGYLIICFASVIWSAQTQLTIRRLLILFLFLIGILGTTRHFSTRNLLDFAIFIGSIFIVLGLTNELINGTFAPLKSGYRFAGTMHPNMQGSVCAVLVLSAYCMLRQAGSTRWTYLLIAAIGMLFLFLTKSRSNIFACCIAAFLTSFWKTSFRAKQLLVLVPLFLICLALLTASVIAPDSIENLDRLITLGRNLDASETMTFTGRIPLWLTLKEYITQRPLLGYGYNGFWSQQIIQSLFTEFGWVITSSHSLIIDLLLQLGFIGAFVYGLSILSVFYYVLKDCAASASPEILFTFALTIFAFIFSLMESQFLEPKTFGAFTISVALVNCCIIKKPYDSRNFY